MTPDDTAEVELDGPVDVRRTVMRHSLYGPTPCWRAEDGVVLRAVHTDEGPTTARYTPLAADRVRVEAWGAGASTLVSQAPALLGLEDDRDGFTPDQPLLRDLARRYPGVRLGRTGRVWPRLAEAILGQLVTGKGAGRSFRKLVRTYGEPAPLDLVCMPLPEVIGRLAPFHLVPIGVEAKRSRTLISCAHHHKKLRKVEAMPPGEAEAWLQRLPGVGPWTAALVVGSSHGWSDAVPVGDYNLPHLVAYSLLGKRRSDDAEMLELLEPYRPHRGRVIRLLQLGGRHPPRRGPRRELRDIG